MPPETRGVEGLQILLAGRKARRPRSSSTYDRVGGW